MNARKRYYLAHLICDYLLQQNMRRAEVTARDIVHFHQLSSHYVLSISALLRYITSSNIKKDRFGFSILGKQFFKKGGYPLRYTIELQGGAKG